MAPQDTSAAHWVQPLERSSARGTDPQFWSLSLPPCPASPEMAPALREGYSCHLSFCQQADLLGHCLDHLCAQSKGCQPPASPSHGQGRGTGSLVDLSKSKPPKLHEQFPTGGQQWGQCWGGQGGQPGRLQVSDQANLAASQGWDESRKGSKATNLTHLPG